MTDEQWLWLYANMLLDRDIELEGMCPQCRDEVTSANKCHRCGKSLSHVESGINPNFDRDRFDKLSGECDGINHNFDEEEYNRIKGGE